MLFPLVAKGFFPFAVRAASVLGCLAVGQNILRLLWNLARYKFKYWILKYYEIPWVWSGYEHKPAPALWKSVPLLMVLGGEGLQASFNLLSDPETGYVRPVVYSGFCVGFDPCVTVCDSKYFSEILNDTDSFPKYKPLYSLFDLILAKGLVAASGEHHRKQRKLITPVFHFGALRSSMDVIQRNTKSFLEDVLPSQNFIIKDNAFKTVTLGVIIDYAFSGAFDKKWMQVAWHNILSFSRLQSLIRVFFANYISFLPTPISVYVALVRLWIRAYLWQRRRFLKSRNITQEQVYRAVEEQSSSPSPSKEGELSIDLGMNLADQVRRRGDAGIAVAVFARRNGHPHLARLEDVLPPEAARTGKRRIGFPHRRAGCPRGHRAIIKSQRTTGAA